MKLLTQVSDRLWLPHQAALEFQENRLTVIAEQLARFDEVREVLAETLKTLRSGLDRLQLQKRHSTINPSELIEEVDASVREFEVRLAELERGQPKVYENDAVRARLDTLFAGKIGAPFNSQAELDKIYQEGKTRYEQRIPPGFEDSDKVKPNQKDYRGYFANGLIIKREYGDLLLWFQVIQEAKSQGLKEIIFVTDDDKEDWWWVIHSKGRKTIGARPELVEEISRKAEVAQFHMYNSERFLEFARQYLQADVDRESISQVREIAELHQASRAQPMSFGPQAYSVASEAVADWVTI